MDGYEHVNNTVYAYWINESVPNEVTDQMMLKNLRIYYKREITYPNNVFIHNRILEKGHILHRIDQANEKNLVYAESFWGKK